MSQDPYDDPGHGRPGGVDDPVDPVDYGDVNFAPEEKQEVYEDRVDHAREVIEELEGIDEIIHDQRYNDAHEFMVALEKESDSWFNVDAVPSNLGYHMIEGGVKQVLREPKGDRVVMKIEIWLPNTEAP